MLNGSGMAAGRALVAIIENYQQADGVPGALRAWMGAWMSLVISPRRAAYT
jgi:seryl-tRNA synthetase